MPAGQACEWRTLERVPAGLCGVMQERELGGDYLVMVWPWLHCFELFYQSDLGVFRQLAQALEQSLVDRSGRLSQCM